MQLQTFCFDGDRSNEKSTERSLSLYIRYQTTNERAFSKCLSDLLKLRAERRKDKIGFESQQLKKDDLARKQPSKIASRNCINATFGSPKPRPSTRNCSITGWKRPKRACPTGSNAFWRGNRPPNRLQLHRQVMRRT